LTAVTLRVCGLTREEWSWENDVRDRAIMIVRSLTFPPAARTNLFTFRVMTTRSLMRVPWCAMSSHGIILAASNNTEMLLRAYGRRVGGSITASIVFAIKGRYHFAYVRYILSCPNLYEILGFIYEKCLCCHEHATRLFSFDEGASSFSH